MATSGEAVFKQQLLNLHNRYKREKVGPKAKLYKRSPRLDRAAEFHATNMASGNSPWGHGNWAPRIRKFLGPKLIHMEIAENIAFGQRTAREVFQDWVESPGHEENIRRRSLTKIGFGYAKSKDGRTYWVVDFGSW